MPQDSLPRCRHGGYHKVSFRSRAKARQSNIARRSKGVQHNPEWQYECRSCGFWHNSSSPPRVRPVAYGTPEREELPT
jgi:rubrerythrin